MGKIEVFCPVPPLDNRGLYLAPRLETLAGTRVGFLGNLKPNCDVLLHTTKEEMKRSWGVADTMYREKSSCSLGAPEAMLDEIAANCQAAVVALGD